VKLARLFTVVGCICCAILLAPVAGHAWENGQGPEDASARAFVREGVRRTLAGNPAEARKLWTELAEADPSEPAAPVFDAYTLFSMQVSDEHDTDYDAQIALRAEEGIGLARARVAADDEDADAQFLLGQALFHRARLKGIRGRLISAGSDGEEAREHLERALEARPAMADAKLPLGMWYFYAGRLPAFVKWMSWLWFIPTGDSETGLRFLQEVYANGDLYRWDAAFMLMNIYTQYEPDHSKAFALGRELIERYPNNLLVRNEYLELLLAACRFEETIEEAQRIEALPAQDERSQALRRIARVWRARAEIQLGEPQRAQSVLAEFGQDGPERPYWGSAWIGLVRGHALDVQGQRAAARAEYERVSALEPPHGSRRAAQLAKEGLRTPFDPDARSCEPGTRVP
jgi:tetratricopeptide (TPR) repeat protein